MSDMNVELKSEWLDTRIELLKTLHGYELRGVNEEVGSVDYVIDCEDTGRRLLRVMVDSKFNASTGNMKSVEKTLGDLEGEKYDEAIIVAEGFTDASESLIMDDKRLELITQDSEHYSVTDLLDAIERKTRELCEAKCGKFPTSSEDCEGRREGRYVCDVRRVSDDSDFHAERGWVSLLLNDFDNLIELKREIKT